MKDIEEDQRTMLTVEGSAINSNIDADEAENFLDHRVAAAGLEVVAALLLNALSWSVAPVHCWTARDGQSNGGENKDGVGKHVDLGCWS